MHDVQAGGKARDAEGLPSITACAGRQRGLRRFVNRAPGAPGADGAIEGAPMYQPALGVDRRCSGGLDEGPRADPFRGTGCAVRQGPPAAPWDWVA